VNLPEMVRFDLLRAETSGKCRYRASIFRYGSNGIQLLPLVKFDDTTGLCSLATKRRSGRIVMDLNTTGFCQI
jgi:hypothetical protein